MSHDLIAINGQTSLSELVRSALPEKRLGYIDANYALISIVSATAIEDCVEVAKEVINSLAEADRNDLLDPPLPVELSKALQMLAESTEGWTSHEYDGPFSPEKFVVNPDAMNAVELLLSGVVDYGSRRSLTANERMYEEAYGVKRNG